jgi:hypothetical protein
MLQMSKLKFFVQWLEKPVICESSIEDLVLQIRCIPPVSPLPNFLPVSSGHVTSQIFFRCDFLQNHINIDVSFIHKPSSISLTVKSFFNH